jgi:hypothetical protein
MDNLTYMSNPCPLAQEQWVAAATPGELGGQTRRTKLPVS